MCTPYTFKRRACWYLRLRVPSDLVGIFPRQIVRTLETRDISSARQKALRAATIAPTAWLQARQMAMKFLGKRISDLTASDLIAAKANLDIEFNSLSDEEKKEISVKIYEIFSAAVTEVDNTKSELSAIEQTIDVFSQVASKAKLDGMREAMTLLSNNQVRQSAPEPDLVEVVAWDSLIEQFHKSNGTSENTIANYKSAFDKFRIVIGSKFISQITKKDIVDYKDFLVNYRESARKERNGYSHGTIKKFIGQIAFFLTWARQNDYITINPADDVSAPKQTKEDKEKSRRDPFSKDDLIKLFSSPIYTGCYSKHRRSKSGHNIYRDEYYYFFLCSLLTGARVDELQNACICSTWLEYGASA